MNTVNLFPKDALINNTETWYTADPVILDKLIEECSWGIQSLTERQAKVKTNRQYVEYASDIDELRKRLIGFNAQKRAVLSRQTKPKLVKKLYSVGRKTFLTEEDLNAYRARFEPYLSFKFYLIKCNPELTEHGKYQDMILVGREEFSTENALQSFLVNQLGDPIARIHGVEPTANWSIVSEYDYKNADHMIRNIERLRTFGLDLGGMKLSDIFLIDKGGQIINVVLADVGLAKE